MTLDELLALGVSTDISTASRALGISPSNGYTQVKKGEFPCRVVKVGARYVVPTVGLFDLLGIERPVNAGAA